MKRYVVGGVVGYLLGLLVIAYIVLITAVAGPIDWPEVAQSALIFGAGGSCIGVLAALKP